jgi:hypothetical protein
VEIDSVGLSITKVASGVPSNAIGFLTGDSAFPLVIGREDADSDASAWATLELGGLGAGAGGEFLYRRTWL